MATYAPIYPEDSSSSSSSNSAGGEGIPVVTAVPQKPVFVQAQVIYDNSAEPVQRQGSFFSCPSWNGLFRHADGASPNQVNGDAATIGRNVTLLRIAIVLALVAAAFFFGVMTLMAMNLFAGPCDNVQPGLKLNPLYANDVLCLTCTGWGTDCMGLGWSIKNCAKDCYCYQRAPPPIYFGPEACGDLTTFEKFNQASGWIGVVGGAMCLMGTLFLVRAHNRRTKMLRLAAAVNNGGAPLLHA